MSIHLQSFENRARSKKKNDREIDGEIDLIIQVNSILYLIEIKKSAMSKADMASKFDVRDGVPEKKWGMRAIICLIDRKMFLRENLVALPLSFL